jgi:hypothetical protein
VAVPTGRSRPAGPASVARRLGCAVGGRRAGRRSSSPACNSGGRAWAAPAWSRLPARRAGTAAGLRRWPRRAWLCGGHGWLRLLRTRPDRLPPRAHRRCRGGQFRSRPARRCSPSPSRPRTGGGPAPGRGPGEPVRRRLAPPVGETQLGAGRHHPVERGQRQVGAHARARVRTSRPDHLVHDGHQMESAQHTPRGRDVAKGQVPRARRQRRRLPRVRGYG